VSLFFNQLGRTPQPILMQNGLKNVDLRKSKTRKFFKPLTTQTTKSAKFGPFQSGRTIFGRFCL